MTPDTRLRRAAQGIHRAVGVKQVNEHRRFERFERFRARKDRNRAIGAIALVAALVAVVFAAAWAVRDISPVTPADQATTPVPTNIGTVTIANAGCTLDGAMNAPTGPFTVTVVNRTNERMDVDVFWLPDDHQFHKVLTYVEGTPPIKREILYARTSSFIAFEAQIQTSVDGRDSRTISGWLEEGTYGIRCSDFPGVGFRPSDIIGPIEVR